MPSSQIFPSSLRSTTTARACFTDLVTRKKKKIAFQDRLGMGATTGAVLAPVPSSAKPGRVGSTSCISRSPSVLVSPPPPATPETGTGDSGSAGTSVAGRTTTSIPGAAAASAEKRSAIVNLLNSLPPVMFLVCKYQQYRRNQQQLTIRKVTERELLRLNHKIVSQDKPCS